MIFMIGLILITFDVQGSSSLHRLEFSSDLQGKLSGLSSRLLDMVLDCGGLISYDFAMYAVVQPRTDKENLPELLFGAVAQAKQGKALSEVISVKLFQEYFSNLVGYLASDFEPQQLELGKQYEAYYFVSVLKKYNPALSDTLRFLCYRYAELNSDDQAIVVTHLYHLLPEIVGVCEVIARNHEELYFSIKRYVDSVVHTPSLDDIKKHVFGVARPIGLSAYQLRLLDTIINSIWMPMIVHTKQMRKQDEQKFPITQKPAKSGWSWLWGN